MGNCAGVFYTKYGEVDIGTENQENDMSFAKRSTTVGKVKARNINREKTGEINENSVEIRKLRKIQAAAKGFLYRLKEKRIKMANKGLFKFFNLGVEGDNEGKYKNLGNLGTSNSISNNVVNSMILIKKTTKDESNLNKISSYDETGVVKREKEIQIDQNRRYEGDWMNGVRTGFGRLKWNDGSIYTGMFLNNKAQGFGTLKHPDGDVYIGQWVNDKAQGVGKYINSKESSFQGYWMADKQEDYGYEVWAKGSIFEGTFKNGNKHGIGILRFEDNACYSGEFFRNEINGIGTCIFKDNRKYEGQWKDNKMNGYGILTWPNGKTFQGHFVNDKKEGYGVYYSKNKVYIANWKNSKMHGEVIIIEKGLVKRSLWDEGRKLKNLSEDKPLIKEKLISEFINSFL